MFVYALVSGKPRTPIYAFNSERFRRFCHGMRYAGFKTQVSASEDQ